MNLVSSSFVEVAFDALVSMVVISTIACLAVLMLSLARKTSAADRCTVWNSVIVMLLLVPIGTLLFPKIPLGWFDTPSTIAEAEATNSNARFTTSPDMPAGANHATGTPSELEKHRPGTSDPLEFANEKQAASDSNAVKSTGASAPYIGDSTFSTGHWFGQLPWTLILATVWLAMIPVFLTRFALGWLHVRAIERNATPWELANCVSDHPILVSDQLQVPVTTGAFTPKIILPSDACHWKPETLRMVVRHESAHIQRRDLRWQLLVALTRCLYWPQPLFWIATRQMELERERACDDRVLLQGETPSQYASVLLQIAVRFSGQNRKLIAAIPVACKPIERRLAAILEPVTPRGPGHRTARKTISLAICLIGISCCCLRPFDQMPDTLQKEQVERDQEPEDNEQDLKDVPDERYEKIEPLPGLIKGRVMDDQKVPVAGAKVTFYFSGKQKNSSTKLAAETKIELVGITDESGRYEIDSSGHEFHGGYSGRGLVNADGFPQLPVLYIPTPKDGVLDIPNAVFYPKRRISGRIVSLAGGEVPKNCNLRLVGNSGLSVNIDYACPYFFSPTIPCDETGRFETWIPAHMPVAMSVFSEDHSGLQMMIPYEADLGEIKLAKGSRLSGQVRDIDNNPVGGVIVRIQSCEHLDFDHGGRQAQYRLLSHSIKTDELGGYELPPFRGKCLVWVTGAGNLRDGSTMHADRKPPVIKPQIVNLTDAEETSLNLSESATVSVRGTVRWEDGTPASNIDVTCSIHSELPALVSISDTFTDEQGQYNLIVPRYTKDGKVRVSISGAINPGDGLYYDPETDNELDVSSRSKRSMTLKATLTDLDGADWLLRSR